MNLSANKALTPKPPEKGSFPLDHDHDCTELTKMYLTCMKENNQIAHKCIDLSKAYLKCRMNNGLMAPESMEDLGYKEPSGLDIDPNFQDARIKQQKKGFTQGLARTQELEKLRQEHEERQRMKQKQ